MENFSPISATIGGAMIGFSAVWLMLSVGRIAGISGILGGIIKGRENDKAWRFSFFIGLMIGPQFIAIINPSILMIEFPVEGPFLIIGAILVWIVGLWIIRILGRGVDIIFSRSKLEVSLKREMKELGYL